MGAIKPAPPTFVRQPTLGTLKRYGLSVETWQAIADRQGGRCAVCKRLPESGTLHVDHDHVPKWKKLPPAERVKHVRGLLCFPCNSRHCGKGMTAEKALGVHRYLAAHEVRVSGTPANDNRIEGA